MGVIAVTGSASGIGAAACARLQAMGHRVIGIDLYDADVIADLGDADGRRAAVAGVTKAAGGTLDGLVACAGIGPHSEPRAKIVSVNYFGATELLAGLRTLLAAGTQPAAVAVSSNSSMMVPVADHPMVTACLEGNEEEACRHAAAADGTTVYAGTKQALARFVRRNATGADWAGAGIRLNAVAPGAVMTPLLRDGLNDPEFGPAIREFPIPLGGFGQPEQLAGAVAFLIGPDSSFCCGSVLFVDGGSDALVRPDTY